MELSNWEKSIVAYVAIFLLFGIDGTAFHQDSVMVWNTFADNFVDMS